MRFRLAAAAILLGTALYLALWTLPVPAPLADPGFLFAAAGDHAGGDEANASLDALAASGADYYLALGDLGYGGSGSEEAWCAQVTAQLGPAFPFELLAGNHDDDLALDDAWIGAYADCLPDRLDVTGIYAAQYYFDHPRASPLVRTVLISPDLTTFGVAYTYAPGSPERAWLVAALDGARAAGIPWVVVGMHKNCITAGEKACQIGASLFDLLLEKRVDLILQAHDHNVQRSKQLACPAIAVDGYRPSCVVDDGADGRYAKGAGSIVVISGSFGQCCVGTSSTDPEAGYFATRNHRSSGFWTYAVTRARIDAAFVATGTTNGELFADAFSIVA